MPSRFESPTQIEVDMRMKYPWAIDINIKNMPYLWSSDRKKDIMIASILFIKLEMHCVLGKISHKW